MREIIHGYWVSRALNRAAISENGRVEFYGRIVDQDGNPVEGVDVPAEILVEEGYYKQRVTMMHCVTDADGRFTVSGVKGSELILQNLTKDGFFPTALGAFEFNPSYAKRHHADPANPLKVVMWRHGPTEPLIKATKFFVTSPDGAPLAIDLTTGKRAEAPGPGCLVVTVTRPAQIGHNVPFDWSFSVELTDGGLIETTDDLRYRAPSDGYMPRLDYRPTWAELTNGNGGEIRRKFYFRGPDGTYYASGLLRVKPVYRQKDSSVEIEYLLNPGGSRNLEPDTAKIKSLGNR